MNGPRVAVIGVPGKWSTEVLADALEAKTGFRLVIDMADVSADLSAGALWGSGVNLCELDGIAVKKIARVYSSDALDRIELLRLAEAGGARVFSPVETSVRMLNRLACTMTLKMAGIPMPKTVVTEDVRSAVRAVRDFGAGVLKPMYSTKARGMRVIEADRPDEFVKAEVETFKNDNPVMYIQEKLPLGGRDYAMVFLGGEYLGSYARVARSGAWNTTIDSGGRYERHEPDARTIALASKAERLFKMDFTTVDLADTPNGPVVFEVSAFGGFKGAREGIGIDAADRYADYMVRRAVE